MISLLHTLWIYHCDESSDLHPYKVTEISLTYARLGEGTVLRESGCHLGNWPQSSRNKVTGRMSGRLWEGDAS